MNYLYDKIMYLIIVLSLFLISYLIFKKPKRMSLLSINELEDPPKYEDIFIINKPKIILLIEDSLLYVKKTSFYYQKFVNSQKAEIKRTFFLIVIALLIYFLFFSTLPGHEKILINVFAAGDETCTGIGYTQDPDINSTQCTAYGCYEVGNEATCCPPTANSNNPVYDGSLTFISGTFDDCCGDDSNEYYEECDENVDIFWGGSCGTTDRACCTGANSCIDPDSALCYNNATSYNITGITSGNDQYARCTPSGLWDDCDSDSSTCTNCANVGDWSQSECSGSNCFTYSGEAGVGEYPDTSTEQCCGDDSGENAIIEYNASDAPPPYNDDNTGTTCCNSASDCAETGNNDCTSSTSTAGVFPNEAYCDSNIWYGGDDSSTACNAIMGVAGYWDLGGETAQTECCGDDSAENKSTRQIDESSMDGSSDSPADDACCYALTDCVNSSICYNHGTHTADIDADTDTDYCNSGEWYDCYDDSDCTGGLVCSFFNNCVDTDGFIRIRNLGLTGIENTSHEYTSIRTVLLELNFTENQVACRYINGISPSITPDNDDIDWTSWEPCVKNRIWYLIEGAGEKTVYFQLNYTTPDRLSLFNDTIIYNFTGAGLDETPPNPPIIILSSYVNSNQTIPISWYNASDAESEVLEIPLRYEYILYNSTDVLTTGTTTSTSVNADISSYNFPSDTKLYVNVTVINSAGLSADAGPNSTTIDLEPPYIWPLSGNFQNLTTNDYQSFSGIDEDTYVAASIVNFTWLGQDDITINVDAYSYILTQNPNTNPDNVPEGSIGSFDSETYKNYNNLGSGKYYFKVKARDLADNWGTVNSINFSIDSTAPSKPIIKDESRTGGNITITWYASTDSETNIANYNVSIFDSNNNEYEATIVSGGTTEHTFENVPSGTYAGKVKAKNGVGLWSVWSNEEETISDNEAPIVTATPNGTSNLLVITSSPIIRAWTNEDAVCYYNSSSGDLEFTYSNTTYHETKILNLNDGSHSYKITCIDPASNSGEGVIDFIIDSSKTPEAPVGSGNKDVYEDILTTFSVQIQNGSDNLAGIISDRFELYINDEETEFSVFDLGTGFYNVSFDSPSVAGSSYTIKTRLDSNSNKEDSFILTVKELYLSTLFEDSGISPLNTQHITADSVTDGKIGLASNSPDPDIGNTANKLNISNIKLEDELFIFNTKSAIKTNNIENLLEQQNFLPLINPSFGYKIDDKYIINFILRYDNFAITSEIGSTLRRGQYNTLVRNTLTSSGDRVLKFTRAGSDSGRIVLQD